MSKPYISYIDPATMKDAAMLAELERCRSYGTPRPESQAIRAHVPAVFWSFANSWREVFHTGVADHAIKELCRLYVSRSVLCEFCGNQRSIKAAKAGEVIEDHVKDLINFEASTRYNDKQKAALSYAEAITWDLPVDEKFWARLHKHFSEPELVEIGYFIALTMGQQRWLRTLNIEHHQMLAGPGRLDGARLRDRGGAQAHPRRRRITGRRRSRRSRRRSSSDVYNYALSPCRRGQSRPLDGTEWVRGQRLPQALTPHPFVLVPRSVSPSPTRGEGTIESARLLPCRFRHRHDHVELDPRTGRTELVDAHGGAGRQPVTEIGRHGLVHGVGLAEIGEIFRHLDHVAPRRPLAVEDRLDRVHPHSIEQQTKNAMDAIKSILDSQGATWRDVIKVTKYLTDFREADAMHKTMAAYFGDWLPASTTVCINQLSSPGARIELDMIVALPKSAGK